MACMRIDGAPITKARWLKGWTQAELARQAGVSPHTVCKLERGCSVNNPRGKGRQVESIRSVAAVLDVDLGAILIWDDDEPSAPAEAVS